MSGLGEQGGLPGFLFSGGQVAPADIDRYETADFIFPGITAAALGTAALTAAGAIVFDNTRLDYPRNILFTMTGVAGGMGGTVTINGVDRWGNSIQEVMGFASANGGGSVAGTSIFTKITSGSLTGIDNAGGTGVGTLSIGYAIGTGATNKFWLGLPTKIGGTADIKNINSILNFVSTNLSGGTYSTTHINLSRHAISGTQILGSADCYIVTYKPTFDNLGKVKMANR